MAYVDSPIPAGNRDPSRADGARPEHAGAPRSSDGGSDGAAVPFLEGLEAENARLRAQVSQLRLISDSATDYAIITLDLEGCITSWNVGAQRTLGYAEAEVLGRSGDIVFTSEDRVARRFEGELARAVEAGRASNERWHLRKDGTRFWASGMMMPMLDGDGHPLGFLNILRDRTEARAEVERRELLMAEMNHRIKNTFSMVQAVAARTRRHASTLDDFQRTFAERLLVLARSNEVLIRGDWEDAPVKDVIEAVLAPHAGQPGRISVEGPSVLLAASLVSTVSLAFHELATNAVKYGALSVPEGTVRVEWTLSPAKASRRVDIVWRERGGPPVQRPKRRGFGTQLLEQGPPAGGEVRLNYPPTGLECSIRLPLVLG